MTLVFFVTLRDMGGGQKVKVCAQTIWTSRLTGSFYIKTDYQITEEKKNRHFFFIAKKFRIAILSSVKVKCTLSVC